MPKFGFILASLLLAACSSSGRVTLEETSRGVFLKRGDKGVMGFRDTTAEECYDCADYSLKPGLDRGDIAVIFAQYWEGYKYVAVDLRNGDTASMWGVPLPDPTGSWILSANADLESEYTPTGVQIFQTGNGIRKVVEIPMKDWEPYHPRWISADSIRLVVHKFNYARFTQAGSSGPYDDLDSAWLVKSKNTWKLELDGHPHATAEPLRAE